MSDAEREDYEDLLSRPGWARWIAYATNTWEHEFGTRVAEAVGVKLGTADGAQVAVGRLQQAVAIREELRQLLAYPAQRVKQLKAQQMAAETRTGFERRPAGL